MNRGSRETGRVERLPVSRPLFSISPFSPLEDIFEPMRMLDDFFRPSRFFDDFFRRSLTSISAEMPSMDVEETDDEYLVSVDLPGFKKDEIKVECTENRLTISAERSESEERRRRSRRYYGSFYHSFTLPRGTDVDQIRADYEDGVLTVRIPRSESARARQIEIGAGGTERQIEGGRAEKSASQSRQEQAQSTTRH